MAVEATLLDIRSTYVLNATFNVFLMQLGFCMLEVGSVRTKNVNSILVKNLQGTCITALAYFMTGFAIANGPGSEGSSTLFSGASGSKGLFLIGIDESEYGVWALQYVFAAASTSIVSGAVAERCSIIAYLMYAFIMGTLCYPIVNCWIWNAKGWLHYNNPDAFMGGVIDTAGCGVVHLTGGMVALLAAWATGPREGRFQDDQDNAFVKNSNPLRALGVFLLWFAWYYFNTSSDGRPYSVPAQHIVLTTTLSASVSSLLSMLIQFWRNPTTKGESRWDLDSTLNGILAGLVSITSGCSVVEYWAAIVIGMVGSFIWIACDDLVMKYKIDDVVSAVAVHMGCGVWGLLASALFACPRYISLSYGNDIEHRAGFFYSDQGAKLLLATVVAIICIIVWVFLIFAPFFTICSKLGILRVSQVEEIQNLGLDCKLHGNSTFEQTSTSQDASGIDPLFHDLNPKDVLQYTKALIHENQNRIDKSSLLAIALSRNVKNFLGVLLIFDTFGGGNNAVSGVACDMFIQELRKKYRPDLNFINTHSSSSNLVDNAGHDSSDAEATAMAETAVGVVGLVVDTKMYTSMNVNMNTNVLNAHAGMGLEPIANSYSSL